MSSKYFCILLIGLSPSVWGFHGGRRFQGPNNGGFGQNGNFGGPGPNDFNGGFVPNGGFPSPGGFPGKCIREVAGLLFYISVYSGSITGVPGSALRRNLNWNPVPEPEFTRFYIGETRCRGIKG